MTASMWWQASAAQGVLNQVLQEINRGRAASPGGCAHDVLRDMVCRILSSRADLDLPQFAAWVESDFFERLLGRPGSRLAVYGSLAPGEKNHWVVEDLRGSWEEGFVYGTLENVGWGGAIGYPGMTWMPEGHRIPVKLFVSSDLSNHWERLDEFEGQDYLRILVPVYGLAEGTVVANIYEVRRPLPGE